MSKRSVSDGLKRKEDDKPARHRYSQAVRRINAPLKVFDEPPSHPCAWLVELFN